MRESLAVSLFLMCLCVCECSGENENNITQNRPTISAFEDLTMTSKLCCSEMKKRHIYH